MYTHVQTHVHTRTHLNTHTYAHAKQQGKQNTEAEAHQQLSYAYDDMVSILSCPNAPIWANPEAAMRPS